MGEKPENAMTSESLESLESLETLVNGSIGDKAQIHDLIGETLIVARLVELGFTRGAQITLKGRAPFGEPFLVEVDGSVVALRRNEILCIKIKIN